MSKLTNPTEVRYFASCLYQENIELEEILTEKFSFLDEIIPSFNPLNDYYQKEMGANLKRKIIVFNQIEKREKLIDYKLWSNGIEQQTALQGSRIINIDLGYIAKEQVLLATGKPYSHRIHLNHGVYAELVYTYQDKTFKSLPWTYPDYQHEEKIHFFNRFRP